MLPTHIISSLCSEHHSEPPQLARRRRSFGEAIRSLLDGVRLLWNSPKRERSPWMLGVILAMAVFLAYSNSLYGPFLYDDHVDILENPSIRHLWPLRDVFFIPGKGFMTRPVANLTFALNLATAGLDSFYYHLTNLVIHICASLAFLGVVRRTLSLPALKERYVGSIPTLSLITAALWALHPLLTESVSYITQRYESLMGLFVLGTFYCVLRMADSPSPVKWSMFASLSCLLALGSKEVAVSVPILVLLFDRTFMAGSFRGAWRERRVLYLGLMVGWACFAFIQSHAMERTWAGFGLTMPWERYALNQPRVILHYLRLALWPHPLNFDYFWRDAKNWAELLPGLLAIGSLLGLTFWALVRKPRLAFFFVFFFFILAPTSSVMPILDLAVEHRMYLPLAPVVVVLVFTIYNLFTKIHFSNPLIYTTIKLLGLFTLASSLAILGSLTYLRNEDYKNPIDIWRDAVNKAPDNPRAHHNYAYNLAEAGYFEHALHEYAFAIKLAPNMPIFRSNYGVTLGKIGRYSESLEQLRWAVKLDPNNSKYISNLGSTLLAKGSLDNAAICFETAIKIDPQMAAPYAALSSLALIKNQPSKAYTLIQKAISLQPYNPNYQHNLGLIFLKLGDHKAARSAFQSVIRLDANPAKMHALIGWIFHNNGLDQDAVSALRQSLRLKPGTPQSQIRLAWILATSSDDQVRNGAEALALAESVLKSHPFRSPEMLDLLAVSLAESGRFPEAQAAIQEALAQSKDRKDGWVPDLEKRLALFEKGQVYRESPKGLFPSDPSKP